MSKWKRLAAIVLATVLAVYGLPAVPASADPELDQPAMRFKQTGFDPATGILTMSLQVKPDAGKSVAEGMFLFQSDVENVIPVTRTEGGTLREEFISYDVSGHPQTTVAVFSDSTVPVLEQYLGSGKVKRIANTFLTGQPTRSILKNSYTGLLVSGARSATTGLLDCYLQFSFGTNDSSSLPTTSDGYVNVIEVDFQCYAGYDENGRRQTATNTDSLYSRSIRVPKSAAEAQDIADQFVFYSAGYTYTNTSGNTITVPAGSIHMTMQSAGFLQASFPGGSFTADMGHYFYNKAPVLSQWRKGNSSRSRWSLGGETGSAGNVGIEYDHVENKYVVNGFVMNNYNTYSTDQVWVETKPEDPVAGTPAEGYYKPVDNPDFTVPSNDLATYPRYNVPTYERSQTNDRNGSWVPGNLMKDTPTKLKYYATVKLGENAEADPENGGIENLMSRVTWRFLLADSTGHGSVIMNADPALPEAERFKVEETGVVKLVPTTNDLAPLGKYRVKEVRITDKRVAKDFIGKKAWVVYLPQNENDPSRDTYYMVTPVGVTLDMLPTEISYYNNIGTGGSDTLLTETADAPQLHVDSTAADDENYIWKDGVSGRLQLQAVYTHGASFSSYPITMRLYKNTSTAVATGLDTASFDGVSVSGGADRCFHVGNTKLDGTGTETAEDCVSKGISITSTLYDQYRVAVPGEFTTVTFEPDAATQADMNSAGKGENPFQVVQVQKPVQGSTTGATEPTNSYTIIYKDGKGVNDVVPGTYILKASYAGLSDDKLMTLKVRVEKPEDRLNYLHTELTRPYTLLNTEEKVEDGVKGTEITVQYDVPTRDDVTFADKVVTEVIQIKEMANQWRTGDTKIYRCRQCGNTAKEPWTGACPNCGATDSISEITQSFSGVLSDYDILPGKLRAPGAGAIDLAAARRVDGLEIKVDIEGEINTEAVRVYELEESLKFTYNNRATKDDGFSCKITVSYKGQSRFIRYNFNFARDQRVLKQMKITQPEDSSGFIVTVPGALSPDNRIRLEVKAFDQYGSQWELNNLMDSYAGNGYTPWRVYVEGTLPQGVHLTDKDGNTAPTDSTGKINNYNYITVDSTATRGRFQVYTEFAGVESSRVTVRVQRENSKPQEITKQNLYYSSLKNEIISPWKTASAKTVTPTLTVYDQYNTQMTEFDNIVWTASIPAVAKEYITINNTTGALTVQPCAPACTVNVSVMVSGNSTSQWASVQVKIVRDTLLITTLEVEDAAVKYQGPVVTLVAKGMDQYSTEPVEVKSDAAAGTSLKWRLDEVWFNDGTHLVRATKEEVSPGTGIYVENPTGQIPLVGGEYVAKDSLRLSENGGVIGYKIVSTTGSIPTKMTVSAQLDGRLTATRTFNIACDPSTASSVYVPAASTGIQIERPAVGATTEVELEAEIKDQYSIVMHDEDAVWTAPNGLPAGVSATALNQGKISVDHTAQPGSFLIRATCGSVAPVDVYVNIIRDPANPPKPAKINITGVMDHSGNVTQDYSLVLPAKPVGGSTATVQCTMMKTVQDQFTDPMSTSLKWTVTNKTTGLDVEIKPADQSSGVITLSYSPDLFADDYVMPASLNFTVKAEAVSDPTVTATKEFTVTLAASVPSYAVPEMTHATASVVEGGVTKPVVPMKGGADTDVTIEAMVYDQYGQKMASEPATLTLTDPRTGLAFRQVSGVNRGILTVKPNVLGDYVNIRAVPQGTNNVRPISTTRLALSKGTAYPFSLVLDEHNATENVQIPEWGSPKNDKVPTAGRPRTLPLSAQVQDQYTAWLEGLSLSGDCYPEWEIVGDDHEGVSFSDASDPDHDGVATGENITLEIAHNAIPKGSVEKIITIQARTYFRNANEYQQGLKDPDFNKTFTIQLTRDPEVTPSYLYIDGVQASGVSAEPMMRPYAKDKKLEYQFKPVVYDQYGNSIDDCPVDMDLYVPSVTNQDVQCDPVYEEGLTEEELETAKPIGYTIYRLVPTGEMIPDPDDPEAPPVPEYEQEVLAEFDRVSGVFTRYTACPLTYVILTAVCDQLETGRDKWIRLVLGEEDPRPYRVELLHNHEGNGTFIINSQEDEPQADYITARVYDQYEEAYPVTQYQGFWELMLRDKDGNLVKYDNELDEEGNPISSQNQFLVVMSAAQGRNTTVTAYPARFYEDKTVVLRCGILNLNDTSTGLTYVTTDLNVRRRRSSSGTSLCVSFDAGNYGKLVGQREYYISPGESPPGAPGVKTQLGYGFVGWTADGKTLVDALEIALYNDTTYYAVYKDITDTACITGYSDKTFRPEEYITRAEYITMLVGAIGGYDSKTDYTGGDKFPDVPKGSWCENVLAYAKQSGIARGYPDGTFRPDDPVSRAEAARFLAVSINVPEGDMGGFIDVQPSQWYAPYVYALKSVGVVAGYHDNTYKPDNLIVRSEAVLMVIKVTKNAPSAFEKKNIRENAYCPFTDVKRDYWAYAYILRAAGVA